MGPGGGRWVDIISPLTNPEQYDQSEITEMVSGKKERGEDKSKVRRSIIIELMFAMS